MGKVNYNHFNNALQCSFIRYILRLSKDQSPRYHMHLPSFKNKSFSFIRLKLNSVGFININLYFKWLLFRILNWFPEIRRSVIINVSDSNKIKIFHRLLLFSNCKNYSRLYNFFLKAQTLVIRKPIRITGIIKIKFVL